MKLFLLEVTKFEKHLLPIIPYEIRKSSLRFQDKTKSRIDLHDINKSTRMLAEFVVLTTPKINGISRHQ